MFYCILFDNIIQIISDISDKIVVKHQYNYMTTVNNTNFLYLPVVIPAQADDPKEAYFNGTSYLRLVNPMPIWGHSALSLRTCLGKYLKYFFISRVIRGLSSTQVQV